MAARDRSHREGTLHEMWDGRPGEDLWAFCGPGGTRKWYFSGMCQGKKRGPDEESSQERSGWKRSQDIPADYIDQSQNLPRPWQDPHPPAQVKALSQQRKKVVDWFSKVPASCCNVFRWEILQRREEQISCLKAWVEGWRIHANHIQTCSSRIPRFYSRVKL